MSQGCGGASRACTLQVIKDLKLDVEAEAQLLKQLAAEVKAAHPGHLPLLLEVLRK